jgi:hypothetical protein
VIEHGARSNQKIFYSGGRERNRDTSANQFKLAIFEAIQRLLIQQFLLMAYVILYNIDIH